MSRSNGIRVDNRDILGLVLRWLRRLLRFSHEKAPVEFEAVKKLQRQKGIKKPAEAGLYFGAVEKTRTRTANSMFSGVLVSQNKNITGTIKQQVSGWVSHACSRFLPQKSPPVDNFVRHSFARTEPFTR